MSPLRLKPVAKPLATICGIREAPIADSWALHAHRAATHLRGVLPVPSAQYVSILNAIHRPDRMLVRQLAPLPQ